MFDWEGEELANIWGKAGEKEDHIVPFSDENYEKHPGSCGDHSKVSDHKVADATKLDLEHSDEKGHLDNDSQDFVDDNWANVGSFDDLDRILSNNEYGNENILSIDSPNLRDLRSDCEHVKTNLEKMESSEGKNEKSASNFVIRTSPPYDHAVDNVDAAMPRGISTGNMEITGQKQDPLFFLGNEGKESEERYEQHINSKARSHETESSSYKQFINPLVSPSGSNITANQQLTSGSFALVPLSMTPQEKIEKLRRRQQMRALLAIRKQQREFRQIPNFKSCSNESRIDESLMMNTNSLEDSVLHQLENVISMLGIQIRLCIRDSLFRLSQNALQRQYPNQPNQRLLTTNSSADGETKTNPIDRVVAHLLFHRPPELSLHSLDSPSSDSRVETEGSSRGFAFFDSLQG